MKQVLQGDIRTEIIEAEERIATHFAGTAGSTRVLEESGQESRAQALEWLVDRKGREIWVCSFDISDPRVSSIDAEWIQAKYSELAIAVRAWIIERSSPAEDHVSGEVWLGFETGRDAMIGQQHHPSGLPWES
ncbi:MAG: hypothetical protein EOP21_00305 [Hyphomicrobiales bacterium]|nr:MAG: hypothetical protein EOP21_00305 [Hyphomicrobiales bacterium]